MISRFAELAIGIIVGCMPSVQKFFRHVSKNASSFNLRIPYSGNGGLSWRKLFIRSSSPKLSGSIRSESTAPQVKTLNLTRASFTLQGTEPPSPILTSNGPIPSNIIHHDISKQMGDVESATPISWQQYEDNSSSGINETKRAQYDRCP